jgi:hypothetical protein
VNEQKKFEKELMWGGIDVERKLAEEWLKSIDLL